MREPVHDVATGITRLETRRASLASVDQRAGRAGRTGPGTAVRLWAEGATRALAPHAPPEIVRADLSQLLLDCLDWGAEPAALSWLDPPPEPALAAARELLSSLGAIEGGDAPTITPLGRAMRRVPLPPRLALALTVAKSGMERERVARFAMLAGEQGLGGNATDLAQRERRLRSERGPRAKQGTALAARWVATAGDGWGEATAEVALARAYSDRIARARGPARPDGRRGYLLTSGRGAFLEASDPLASEEWLVALDLTGQAREQRIVAAIAIARSDAETAFDDRVSEHDVIMKRDGRVSAVRERRLGAIVLDRAAIVLSDVSPEAMASALADAIRAKGIASLPWEGDAARLRARLAWLHARQGGDWPDVSDDVLAGALEEWLLPHVPGATGVGTITPAILREALLGLVPWERRADLGRLAPERFPAPTGTRTPIVYPADGTAPRLAIRVQELFGLDAHPQAAGEPLLLDLLSPARRPIQTTGDLPGFWRGSWADVRRDMRARYPRHPWPERPWEAEATVRAKPRK